MNLVEIHLQDGSAFRAFVTENQEHVLRSHIGSGNRPFIIQDTKGNDVVLNLNAVTYVTYGLGRP